MKLRLSRAFGSIRNIVPVAAEKKSSPDGIVGEMHMVRRSGWRGGPAFHFYPNKYGESLGLNNATSSSAKQLLELLEAELDGYHRFVARDISHDIWRIYGQSFLNVPHS